MPKKPQPRISRKCHICENTFDVLPSSDKKYCSKKCSNADPDVKNRMIQSLRDKWDSLGGHPMLLLQVQDKHKKTMLERHGVEHALQNHDILEKSHDIKIQRYGSLNNIQKAYETKLKKYGSATYNGSVKRNQTKYEHMTNNWSHVELMFNKEQYTGVDNVKYKFKCTVCNFQFKYSIDNGRIPICRKCNPVYQQNRSKGEHQIIEFIRSLTNTNIETNNRTICNGKELDILLPEYNFAIEYNGMYWHNDDKVGKNYHLRKTKHAIINGYSLLHIFDYQWITKQPIVKSLIRSKLNLSEKIHARKCTVKVVSSKEKNDFLDETHLQGKCNSKINLGLYYNNELVSLMTFGLPRYSKEYDYELIRFSSKLNTTVVGGFSKLLNHFIKTYNPINILTYCDRAISTGNVYIKNNFKLIGITNPNYFYFNQLSVYSREQFQKHKLKDKLPVFNELLTEVENMKLNGYYRYFDCGNYKFMLTVK